MGIQWHVNVDWMGRVSPDSVMKRAGEAPYEPLLTLAIGICQHLPPTSTTKLLLREIRGLPSSKGM